MAGFHSALAPWVGGAGVPPSRPGFRSMLGWWAGGAGAHIVTAPPPQVSSGGGHRVELPRDLREALRNRIIREDDLLLLIIASQFAKRLQ